VIHIQRLSVSYKTERRQVPALKNINLSIPKGTATAIVGESGSGKSTLLHSIMRLLPPEAELSGKIMFEGMDITSMDDAALRSFRWKKCSLVLQGAMSSFNPVLSIGKQIAETVAYHLHLSSKGSYKRAEELLEMVGLPTFFSKRFPHELSGGQKQRAAIAMALACSPPCILADEPTTALDVITQAEIVWLLKEITRKNNMTLCMVTHDLPLALSVCDRVAVMHRGEIVEIQTPSGILNNPTHPHTKKLVESIRSIEERGNPK